MNIKNDAKQLLNMQSVNDELMMTEVSNMKINKTHALFSSTASFRLHGQSTLAKTGIVPYELSVAVTATSPPTV